MFVPSLVVDDICWNQSSHLQEVYYPRISQLRGQHLLDMPSLRIGYSVRSDLLGRSHCFDQFIVVQLGNVIKELHPSYQELL